MLDENVSPAADQPDSRAVGQPLVTLCGASRLLAIRPGVRLAILCAAHPVASIPRVLSLGLLNRKARPAVVIFSEAYLPAFQLRCSRYHVKL
eukprot:1136388-Pelagomonas_calceolata.AAC.1